MARLRATFSSGLAGTSTVPKTMQPSASSTSHPTKSGEINMPSPNPPAHSTLKGGFPRHGRSTWAVSDNPTWDGTHRPPSSREIRSPRHRRGNTPKSRSAPRREPQKATRPGPTPPNLPTKAVFLPTMRESLALSLLHTPATGCPMPRSPNPGTPRPQPCRVHNPETGPTGSW